MLTATRVEEASIEFSDDLYSVDESLRSINSVLLHSFQDATPLGFSAMRGAVTTKNVFVIRGEGEVLEPSEEEKARLVPRFMDLVAMLEDFESCGKDCEFLCELPKSGKKISFLEFRPGPDSPVVLYSDFTYEQIGKVIRNSVTVSDFIGEDSPEHVRNIVFKLLKPKMKLAFRAAAELVLESEGKDRAFIDRVLGKAANHFDRCEINEMKKQEAMFGQDLMKHLHRAVVGCPDLCKLKSVFEQLSKVRWARTVQKFGKDLCSVAEKFSSIEKIAEANTHLWTLGAKNAKGRVFFIYE